MSRERNCAQFAVVMVADRSLVARLTAQVAFAAAECRRDPAGFARALWEGDAFDRRDTRVLWSVRIGLPLVSGLGFGLGVLLYAVLVGVSPVLAQVPDLTAGPPLLAVPLAADAGAQRSRTTRARSFVR